MNTSRLSDGAPNFTPVPADLYRLAEPEAGVVRPALTGRLRNRRPRETFEPDWNYLYSGNASAIAIVAGLCCGVTDPPEGGHEKVMRIYCPKAWSLLIQAETSHERWMTGRCAADIRNAVAIAANTELDGYAVYLVTDIPALMAEIIGGLGGIPHFE
ncbi:hypothetical protein [Nocardia nova]|uniref:hypothetical protein n=1 Tax=Nocardia nova TaxID=37330 RepID=UPI0033F025B4